MLAVGVVAVVIQDDGPLGPLVGGVESAAELRNLLRAQIGHFTRGRQKSKIL